MYTNLRECTGDRTCASIRIAETTEGISIVTGFNFNSRKVLINQSYLSKSWTWRLELWASTGDYDRLVEWSVPGSTAIYSPTTLSPYFEGFTMVLVVRIHRITLSFFQAYHHTYWTLTLSPKWYPALPHPAAYRSQLTLPAFHLFIFQQVFSSLNLCKKKRIVISAMTLRLQRRKTLWFFPMVTVYRLYRIPDFTIHDVHSTQSVFKYERNERASFSLALKRFQSRRRQSGYLCIYDEHKTETVQYECSLIS